MKITKINIPESSIKNGLDPVKMERLGQLVLLAGKNGSGKTRLLNLIRDTIKHKPASSYLNTIDAKKDSAKYHINNAINQIKSYNEQLNSEKNRDKIEQYRNKVASLKKQKEHFETELTSLKDSETWNLIETDSPYENNVIVPFVPKNLDLQDCNNYTKNNIINHSKQVEQLGINSLASGTFAKIQTTQDNWFNATHQFLNVSEADRSKATHEYERLKELIRVFLDTELDRSPNGDATIFGLPLGQSNLSEGQKVLIQLCIAIHSQKKSINEIILFLDEPENHLHPSVIIETIERIINNNPDGQIWIATHSLPLLSYFDPSSIWFVGNNQVSYAGSIPEKVLNSLLGDEERISKLQDFISLPGIFALNRHAFECLFHPAAVETGKDDPQGLQIRREINQHLANNKKIRILDYGAGKGRILTNIIENNSKSATNLEQWIDYIAYDKYTSDKEACTSNLKKVYSNWSKRYFNDMSSLLSNYDKESFDVVIMCNVLHEIEPANWLTLFSKDGEIPRLLSEKGVLLLVEDQEMQIGEKAYQKGFIVLNTPELKELFKITEADTDFTVKVAKENDRLKAHIVGKELLTRITSGSRKKCLKQLHNDAKNKILSVRSEEIKYKNGKRHGFWIQQYANTGLVLDELGHD